MPKSIAFVGCVGLLLAAASARGESRAIRVDGHFDDWNGLTPAYTDDAGDAGSSAGMDFGRVWLANNASHLFLRFQLGVETFLQTDNSLVLYLDTDNSSSTGRRVNGIGADVSWRFGGRTGEVHPGGISFTAYDAGIVTAPTVTSDEFEFEIRRDTVIVGSQPIFPGATIRWLLQDEGNGGGDRAPNTGETASYSFDATPLPPYESIPLSKGSSEHLRVMTYNVSRDGLFERTEYFGRILQAIDADIINFQEIHVHSEEDTRARVEQILPPGPEQHWYAAKQADNVTVSRYPITARWWVDANLAVLINLPDAEFPADLFLINAHLPAGSGNDAERQDEADAIVAFIRDAQTPGGLLTLPPGTPLLIVGDLNLVGLARQLDTLLSGDIEDEGTHGADHPPDWDGTALTDILAYQNAVPEVFTWWNEASSFGPGRLDYIIYSDSILSVRKSLVLRTESTPTTDLAVYGLQRGDSAAASDHLPVVADFVFADQAFSAWMLY